jgi:hypothetical protein
MVKDSGKWYNMLHIYPATANRVDISNYIYKTTPEDICKLMIQCYLNCNNYMGIVIVSVILCIAILLQVFFLNISLIGILLICLYLPQK